MSVKTNDIFKILAAATIFIAFLIFMFKIRSILAMIGAAVLLTLLFDPLVVWIQKYLPSHKRGLAIFSTFILFIIAMFFAGYLIIRPLVSELPGLVDEFQRVSDLLKNSETTTQAISYVEPIITKQNQADVSNLAKEAVAAIGSRLLAIVSSVSYFIYVFITVFTLMFFMLLDTKKALAAGNKFIPDKYHKVYDKLTGDLYGIVTKYFAGALMVAGIAGISSYVVLRLLNVPYAASLSVVVALFDLIPMIGATLGATIVVIFCLLLGNIPAAIITTAFFIVYQQIENNAIIPLVQKKTVKMSPLAVLVALMIGGAIAGIVGALLAIPAAAFIKVIYETFKQEGLIGSNSE